MGILLAFAPFLAFALVDRLVGVTPGLIVGALVSIGLLARDWITSGRSLKVLEVGTALLFTGLATYTLLAKPDWPIMGVRLSVDSGLLLIVLVSMAIRLPFTLQYARESVPREYWDSPEFLRTNYVITAVWALAFAVMVAADLVLIYRPDVPARFGIIATIGALFGAVKFTGWYPDRKKAGAG